MCNKEIDEESLITEEIKEYLHITWNEEDKNIKKMVKEGERYLSEKIGITLDFHKDLIALGLLKDYCRYTRNYSKEYFEQNFIEQILHLQMKYAIENGDSNEGKTET